MRRRLISSRPRIQRRCSAKGTQYETPLLASNAPYSRAFFGLGRKTDAHAAFAEGVTYLNPATDAATIESYKVISLFVILIADQSCRNG